jgi:hypothetical protein
MAIYPPPSYTVPFSGIIFNSSYFTSTNDSSLSVDQANNLYLRKTFSDTATALETFNAGISTPSITSDTTLAIGSVAGNVTITGLNTDIGTTKTSGSTTIGSATIPVTLNGAVSLNTILSTSTLNINATGLGNPINIGGSGTTTTINNILSCDFIRGKDTTGTQSLFDTKTSGNLTCLGVGTGILDIGGSGVKFDTLSTNNPTGVQSLFSNKTAGTLNLGSGMTNGSINLLNTGSGSVNVRGKLVVDNIESTTDASLFSNSTGKITIGSINVGSNTILQAGGELKSLSIHRFNNPLKLSYTPDNIVSGQLGFSVKYNVASGSVASNSSVTVASFTNIPTGIYLLTIGSFTVFGLDINDRVDLQYISSSNVTYLAGTSNMEFGGNLQEKLGICITVPFMIVNATNQLQMSLVSIIGNGFSYTNGASSIIRIA